MINTVLKRLTTLLEEDSPVGNPGGIGTLYHGTLSFEDGPMTRQRLNDLLKQTPTFPRDPSRN